MLSPSRRAARAMLAVAILAAATTVCLAQSDPPNVPSAAHVDFGPLTPTLDPVTIGWIALVVILTLTLQTRPLSSVHNLDALSLGLTCLALPLRSSTEALPGQFAEATYGQCSYVLLTLFAVYWFVRGLAMLFSANVTALRPNLTRGSLSVLVAASLAVACYDILTAPISDGARDGLAGGICVAQTGKLPYGDAAGHDSRSPLVYLAYAPAAKWLEPAVDEGGERVTLMWGERKKWLGTDWAQRIDLSAVRVVNAALFLLTFAAIAGIGHRHHSVAAGQMMAAVFCIFPGTIECLSQPEVMVPTMLLAWSIACLRLPGFGGLLGGVCIAVAGIGSPWAWLAAPALMGYFLRTGWNGLGAMLGLVLGLAGAGLGVATLTNPSLPRSDGALAAAGLSPRYVVVESEGKVRFAPYTAPAPAKTDFKSGLWRFVLQGDTAKFFADGDKSRYELPAGEAVAYRELASTPATAGELLSGYRAAMCGVPPEIRFWPALRTILESTWLPAAPRATPQVPVWQTWFGTGADADGRITWIRRSMKIVVGLIAVLAGYALLRSDVLRPHRVLGGVLAVSAGALLASETGAVTGLVWLLPSALGAMAATSTERAGPKQPLATGERITINA